MRKKVIILIAATFLSKIIAFGKELILAYYYGAGKVSDIYLMALTIPVVIFGFFSTGISSGFVPVYKKAVGDDSNIEKGNKFSNEIIIVLLLLCTILIAIYFPLDEVIIGFFAQGFSDSDKAITVSFSNIMVFSILFSSITAVMRSFLQSNEKTTALGLVSIPLNIVLAISIVLSAMTKNIYILPYGYLVACIVQTFIFYLIAKKYGYKFSKEISINNENVRIFLSSIFILTIGSSVNEINVLVDKMLASSVSVGGVSSLEYGTRIIDLISGVFILSVSTVQFPRFVNFNTEKDKLSNCFREGMEGLSIVLIPLSLTLVFFSREIITLVYARGEFGESAVDLTSPILIFYGLGLIAIGGRELISKLYYALGDMRTPVINAIIGVLINIILNFILVKTFGIGGLALATSISGIIVMVSLLIQVRKIVTLHVNLLFYIKILLITIVSLLISKAVMRYSFSPLYKINAIVGLIVFALVYVVGALLLGIFDIKNIKSILK